MSRSVSREPGRFSRALMTAAVYALLSAFYFVLLAACVALVREAWDAPARPCQTQHEAEWESRDELPPDVIAEGRLRMMLSQEEDK